MPILARCRLAGGAIYALSPTRSAVLDGPHRCTARSQWSARVLSAFSQLSGSPDTDSLARDVATSVRSEEHTSELQSLMRISYAVFCLKKKKRKVQKPKRAQI